MNVRFYLQNELLLKDCAETIAALNLFFCPLASLKIH